MKLLRVDSSARRNSVSRQLTYAFVKAWKQRNPKGEVIERDLAVTPPPPIGDGWAEAAFTPAERRTELQRQILGPSETLIGELQAASLIVIGSPMYNFTISSPLKAWIDHIVRPGRTVVYGPDGAKGLLAGKRVVVLTARGGAYAGEPRGPSRDYQEPYLRVILAYIGLDDVTFIHAEKQQRGDDGALSRGAALKQIEEFVALNSALPSR